jgi:hypothetical protein
MGLLISAATLTFIFWVPNSWLPRKLRRLENRILSILSPNSNNHPCSNNASYS